MELKGRDHEAYVAPPGSGTAPSPGGVKWQAAALLFCVSMGVLLVALIHPQGDGGWFWYSRMFRSGQHLYADMHLALQPLLPLEFALFQDMFGLRWLPFQLLGILNALLFTGGIALVTRFSRWNDWEKALTLVCVFAVTTDFVTFRFDDYHILSACCAVYSMACVLALDRRPSRTRELWLLVALGALSGLCFTNRLNDGALLFASVVFVVFLSLPARKLLSVCVITAGFGVTALAMILSTGDTLRSWWTYSVVRAAAIKGGTQNVLVYPLKLPYFTVHLLTHYPEARYTVRVFVSLALFVVVAYAIRNRRRTDGTLDWRWIGAGVAIVSLMVARRLIFLHILLTEPTIELLVLMMFALCAWVLYRAGASALGRNTAGRVSPVELVLLIPLGQLISISMSSGHWYPNAFPPVAEFLLVVPIASPIRFRRFWQRALLLSVMAFLTLCTVREKVRNPFHWWFYWSDGLGSQRVWYDHPDYGPMWIESRQLDFIKPVCETVHANSSGTPELLSLPFPYANYFCDIAPWHGYVQTFFDTSSEQTINTLVEEMQDHPPQWIFYQRQLWVLKQHEVSFRNGQPLPHRKLDELMVEKVESGQWKIAMVKHIFGDGSDWILIKTR